MPGEVCDIGRFVVNVPMSNFAVPSGSPTKVTCSISPAFNRLVALWKSLEMKAFPWYS